jgi:4a-hydroxytetrahydrobiopterin dehydratase
MAFVNVIAQVAHQQDHHPELTVSYNRCTVSYTTHSVGGLSKKDFICAAKINAAQNL